MLLLRLDDSCHLREADSFRPLFNLFKSFLQFNPGLRLLGDIYCGPNKLHEVALLVHDGTSDRMLVFDGSVGKSQDFENILAGEVFRQCAIRLRIG